MRRNGPIHLGVKMIEKIKYKDPSGSWKIAGGSWKIAGAPWKITTLTIDTLNEVIDALNGLLEKESWSGVHPVCYARPPNYIADDDMGGKDEDGYCCSPFETDIDEGYIIYDKDKDMFVANMLNKGGGTGDTFLSYCFYCGAKL